METLDKTASDLLQKLPEIIKGTTEYGMDLMNRFIDYSLFRHSLNSLLLIITIYILYKGVKKGIEIEREDNTETPMGVFLITFSSFFGIITIGALVPQIHKIFELLFVPELYIIDYFIK